jgi:hypothetical protein
MSLVACGWVLSSLAAEEIPEEVRVGVGRARAAYSRSRVTTEFSQFDKDSIEKQIYKQTFRFKGPLARVDTDRQAGFTALVVGREVAFGCAGTANLPKTNTLFEVRRRRAADDYWQLFGTEFYPLDHVWSAWSIPFDAIDTDPRRLGRIASCVKLPNGRYRIAVEPVQITSDSQRGEFELDPALGYVVVRAEYGQCPPKPEDPSRRVMEFSYDGVLEGGVGKIAKIVDSGTKKSGGPLLIPHQRVYRVTSLEIVDLPDSDFTPAAFGIDFPPRQGNGYWWWIGGSALAAVVFAIILIRRRRASKA